MNRAWPFHAAARSTARWDERPSSAMLLVEIMSAFGEFQSSVDFAARWLGRQRSKGLSAGVGGLHLIWPWQDRKHRFSRLKASTFTLMFVPAIWLLYQVGTDQFGPVPLGGMTYWSGVWATAILLLALAITPALTILRWSQPIIVRRMIGVTALAYTIAHIIIYFALRFWDFAFIAHEMVTRLSLIMATVSTIGLIALGATSLDAAVQRMGAKGWNRLHNTIYVLAALALFHYLL